MLNRITKYFIVSSKVEFLMYFMIGFAIMVVPTILYLTGLI